MGTRGKIEIASSPSSIKYSVDATYEGLIVTLNFPLDMGKEYPSGAEYRSYLNNIVTDIRTQIEQRGFHFHENRYSNGTAKSFRLDFTIPRKDRLPGILVISDTEKEIAEIIKKMELGYKKDPDSALTEGYEDMIARSNKNFESKWEKILADSYSPDYLKR